MRLFLWWLALLAIFKLPISKAKFRELQIAVPDDAVADVVALLQYYYTAVPSCSKAITNEVHGQFCHYWNCHLASCPALFNH